MSCLKFKSLPPDCPFVPQPAGPCRLSTHPLGAGLPQEEILEARVLNQGKERSLSRWHAHGHMEAPKSQMSLAPCWSLCLAEPDASLLGTAFQVD